MPAEFRCALMHYWDESAPVGVPSSVGITRVKAQRDNLMRRARWKR
jgi:hypothetical protein